MIVTMGTMSSRRAAVLLGAFAAVAFGGAVYAIDEMTLDIDAASGAGWRAENIHLGFEPLPQHAYAVIGRLTLSAWPQPLRNVRIDCPQLELSDAAISCRQARVAGALPGLGAQTLTARLRYGRGDGSLDLDVKGVRLGEGTAAIEAALRPGGWTARASLRRVPIELLRKLASDLGGRQASITAQGLVTLSGTARGVGASLRQVEADLDLSELTANNEAGSVASEKLSMRTQVSLQRTGDSWDFSIGLDARAGQVYFQPVFLDFGAHRLSAHAQGRLRAKRELTLERFTVDHFAVAQASGRASLDFAQPRPLRSLRLQLANLQFPGAYESYLQPLLLDTSLRAATTAGSVSGEVELDEGAAHRIDLTLRDLSLDAGARKFAIGVLSGHWHWRADTPQARDDGPGPEVPASSLRWTDGALFGLEIGSGDVSFLSSGRQFRLLSPTRIPVLDGALSLESFRIRNAGLPQVAFMVDATLEPVSVQRLCSAFGWPEFGGRLGGTISKLRMREGVVTLGTTLHAQVFDGRVTISDLKLEQPFGAWPRFYSTITLDGLDLELVTRAFSFGRITGRLSGAIEGLRLFNWAPVAFDARLYTPAGDRSRHRISQRAVQNLGSVGGGGAGVTAALSSGFLRFFEDFNYDRLGLSCRLENEVCLMDGVAPAPHGGYYLVKGKGLPRIDVIGSARRVDWPRLVQQLAIATRSQGPVVQ